MVQENNQGRNQHFAPDSHYIIRIFRYHNRLSPFPDDAGNGLNLLCQKKNYCACSASYASRTALAS